MDEHFSGEFPSEWGDARLTNRCHLLGQRMWESMSRSLTDACQGWAEVMGAVRFFAQQGVTLASMLAAHQWATRERVRACPLVYAIQDTTELAFSAKKTRGMGLLNSPTHTGLLWHLTWVVTPERIPLGIWRVTTWVRTSLLRGKTRARKTAAVEDKESGRWVEGYRAACALQRETGTRVISIADREADLYELFVEATAATETAGWVIRARHPRSVVLQGGRRMPLPLALALAPACGAGQMEVPSAPGRLARTAQVVLKILPVTLRPPFRKGQRPPPVDVTVVVVREVDPPAGREPLQWVLLTSLPVTTLAEAVGVVDIYAARWEIEVFFRTWKTGCRVERLQLSTRERLEPCLAMYAIVAWRLLYLTRLGRIAPDQEAARWFSPLELQVIGRLAGRRTRKACPMRTLGEVLHAVALIGGFLGRRGDGDPGTETLWRGFDRVYNGVLLLEGC